MMYLPPIKNKVLNLTESKNRFLIEEEMKACTSDEQLMNVFKKYVSEEEVWSIFDKHYGYEHIKVNARNVDRSLIEEFDMEFLKQKLVIPIQIKENEEIYVFAINNLIDSKLKENLNKLVMNNKGFKAKFKFAFEGDILEVLDYFTQEELPSVANTGDKAFSATEWVDKTLQRGIDLRASDIHIERHEGKLQVRYRVDGILVSKTIHRLDDVDISRVYVKLKIVSDMDIVESRKPQDGRINDYKHKGQMYDMRVSTVGTIHGEKFVIRIVNKDEDVATFEQLGFTQENSEKIKRMLSNKNGIIYLAGATGSGKTTTLYSMIDHLEDDRVNIYTIEDPVEKTIDNVNQIQIEEASGVDYHSILSALLRQDPNVIVVGEVRDAKTAGLSIRASLTGHLVITTLHANNALDSISRLSDMRMESYLVGASSVGFMSQVLPRKLCPICKTKVETLDVYEEAWMKSALPDFDYELEKKKGNYIYSPNGCNECNEGYKGRIAVIEVLEVDDRLRTMISKGVEISEMREYLLNNGYKTMKTDGALKAKKGITSVVELMAQL